MNDAGACLRCGRRGCRRRGHVPMTEPDWYSNFIAAEDERADKLRATRAANGTAGNGPPTTRQGGPSRDQQEGEA